MKVSNEVAVCNIYYMIREIENAFRTLKAGLALLPITHKSDKVMMAHLHLGILTYWLFDTIRYQLKNNIYKQLPVGDSTFFIRANNFDKLLPVVI